MFTFYVLRNGRRLQTAASRPRSTKNLSSDGSSPIFRIDVFTCKYVATLGSFQWLRFNSTFQESEISNCFFYFGKFFNKACHHELETFNGETFTSSGAYALCLTSRYVYLLHVKEKLICRNLYALFSHPKKSLRSQSEWRTAVFTCGRIANQR